MFTSSGRCSNRIVSTHCHSGLTSSRGPPRLSCSLLDTRWDEVGRPGKRQRLSGVRGGQEHKFQVTFAMEVKAVPIRLPQKKALTYCKFDGVLWSLKYTNLRGVRGPYSRPSPFSSFFPRDGTRGQEYIQRARISFQGGQREVVHMQRDSCKPSVRWPYTRIGS